MNVTSAFGVVHTIAKSEYAPGKYKPATKLTPGQREAVRSGAARRSVPHDLADTGHRDLNAVYHGHAYFDRGLSWTDPADEMKEKAKPSKVHPNIHYGRSLQNKSSMKQMDHFIDPKIAAKLKHPVVLHHDPMASVSGALGAHSTTGGRGHVQLEHEAFNSPDRLRGTVNHELAHAGLKGRNPVMTGARKARVQFGEEARADAVSGANLHTRFRNLHGAASTKKLVAAYPSLPNADKARVRGSWAYHQVRSKVAAAVKKVPR